MISSVLPPYVHNILSHIPWGHWVIICAVAVVTGVLFGTRKRGAAYGAVALGLTVFTGLFLLDTAVFIRYFGYFPHGSGVTLGMDRLVHPSTYGWAELISNVVVFVPFGLFLSELLSSTRRLRAGRQIGYVTLAGLGLSLGIECLQLALGVGYFELTDLVMNTLGAFGGGSLAVMVRRFRVKPGMRKREPGMTNID